ncbi:gp83 [Bacillus phage W.Ph.]|uniref:Gp83 n=1 Tax=Bacillus phage W.Ph. TaxID=764595 RepID=G9B1I4_9CAUD|nr:gp83 [Bacillus phage W.Ph.]ADH03229.1 gp83 [Bacillus phage W.Ph.]
MTKEYMDTILTGFEVLEVLSRGWFRKEGTTLAYTIQDGKLLLWDMLSKKQYQANETTMEAFAKGTFVYQDYKESEEYRLIKSHSAERVMIKTDLQGALTAGQKLISIEHADVGLIDLYKVDDLTTRPATVDDVLYEMHELDLEDIQTIFTEATFWKEA